MFPTVLFDFDGTLTPSLECWLTAFVMALGHYDIAMEEGELIRRCFYRPYADVAADLGLPSGEHLRERVHDALLAAFRDARLFPGVLPLLEELRDRDVALALVTSSPRAVVEQALDDLGIASFFPVVVASEDTKRHKPDPAPLYLALERLGCPAGGGAYIGDYAVDVLAGRAAGLATGLHLPHDHRKFYDFDHLRSLEPDFVFTTFDGLRDHLL